MSKFFKSGDDINGESEKRKNKWYDSLNLSALILLIIALILFIANFIPYVMYHTWPVDETSEIDRFNANAPWALIIFGCYLSPMGMIISAAILLVWAFIDGHILVLFCFRKWVYLIAFPVLLTGTICLCIFVPAWIWAVLFAPLGFCMVISFLGCIGKFSTERVDNDGKIFTLKRMRKIKENQENGTVNQDENYNEVMSEIEAKSIAEQKRHNLEMERIAKQKLQLEKQRAKEEKNKIDYSKCLTCANKKTCGRVACHFVPEK